MTKHRPFVVRPTPRLLATLCGAAFAFVFSACAPDGTNGSDPGSGGSATAGNDGTAGSASQGDRGGAPGTAGATGGSGLQGSGGSTGGSGVAGTGGTTGAAGTSGEAGAGGEAGTSGAAGAAGAAGTNGGRGGTGGTLGAAGAGGRGGTSGAAGTTGAAGRGGTMGSAGTTGRGGTTGIAGTTGRGGTTGIAGTTGAGGSASGADPCRPIGWATRNGRTGGAVNVTGGGNATPIVVNNFADLLRYATDGTPRVIHVDGTVGGGWSGQSGDRLEIKSNKTIVGLRAGTQLRAPIHINSATNVIVRNLVIRGPGSNEDQAWDNLNIEGSSKNVWIDHCEFWDGQDGNADVVKGADNVTFTWNIFGYALPGHPHNLSNLIASSDDEPVSEGKLNITFMFNWWKAVAQRQPRCRYGQIHVVNNLYTGDNAIGASTLGVSNGFQCNVLTENNHFINQRQPIDLGKQAGTGSVQQATGNIFESCTGNQTGSGTAFTPPYEYKSFLVPASGVRALVQQSAGATLTSPTACP